MVSRRARCKRLSSINSPLVAVSELTTPIAPPEHEVHDRPQHMQDQFADELPQQLEDELGHIRVFAWAAAILPRSCRAAPNCA
jgi:hypothetical protein